MLEEYGRFRERPMPAYLVRTIDDHDIVGFFAADDMEDLVIAVDECTEPADCEYVELPVGGIMWSSPAITVPLNPGNCEDENSHDGEQLPWTNAELSETWWSVVYGFTDNEWTEFFPGQPRKKRVRPPRPMGPGRVLPYRKRP
jgi:hypothetical protein